MVILQLKKGFLKKGFPINFLSIVRRIDSVLGIFDFRDLFFDPEVQRLIKERDRARLKKDWKYADKIREELHAKGVIFQDQKI